MPTDLGELIADLEEAQRDIVTGESLEDNASVVVTARDIRVLATALRAFSEAGWRDIKDAPRDGTRFLFVTDEGHISVGFYINEVAFAADSLGSSRNNQPVHFMPLPAPPAQGEK